MPIMKNVYDRETGETLVRDALTARECVDNDPGRYSLSRWKTTGHVSAKDAKAAARGGRKPVKGKKSEVQAEPGEGSASPPGDEPDA